MQMIEWCHSDDVVMSSPTKFSTFLWVSSKKTVCSSKIKKKSMDLPSFMSSFKCCKNFPLKANFSESNFFEVYAVVQYTGNTAAKASISVAE